MSAIPSFANYIADGAVMESTFNNVIQQTQNDVGSLREVFTQRVLPFFSQMLVTVLMMNTSYNNTSYISQDMESKAKDAKQKENLTRSSIHKARFSYMQKKYKIGYNKYVTGVLQGAILVACVAGSLIAFQRMKKLSGMFTGLVVGVIALMFLIIIAVIAKNNMTRRVDDWDKFYFAPYNMSK